MEGSIRVSWRERKLLLEHYRRNPDPAVRLRAQIVLLLADGHPWGLIASVLFCSTATISRWRERFKQEGLDGLLEDRRGRRSSFAVWVAGLAVLLVRKWTPRDFGLLRSRWCCGAVVLLMAELHQVQVSRETVRRWLHAEGLVWRRPRPVLRPEDPRREEILREIRALLKNLPADEIAVFQDEVDINSNPKIGCMWMVRGQQAVVETPGTNHKAYLAGSQNWRTGELIVTEGDKRNSELFVRHLDDLRYHYRCYRRIHVICDNAIFHHPERCALVRQYLEEWGHRVELHFLPTYDPKSNPIERVWWHLHEQITRNHNCLDLDELLDLVFKWLDNRKPMIERGVYKGCQAA